MELLIRVKRAIKCLLGKPISEPKATSHNYHLFINDNEAFCGMTVFVVGGTGAIGSAICYELAAKGAIVGIGGRDKNKVNRIIERIKMESPSISERLIPIVLDVNIDDAKIPGKAYQKQASLKTFFSYSSCV